MKMRLLTLLSLVVITINLYSQNDFQHFKFEQAEYESTRIVPKNEVNSVLKKGWAVLYQPGPGYVTPPNDYEDREVKPFQELIDNGTFSKERMKELAKEDRTYISVYYDETGVVSYVYFWVSKDKKSLLTDRELLLISQKLKTVKYDLSIFAVYKSETGSKTSFYCNNFFSIPFKDLKY